MATELRLTTRWVTAAMAGTLLAGDEERPFEGVSIDTRTLTPGELYVAIRGPRFDGADFAGAAIEAGASGVAVPRGRGDGLRGRGAAVIEVADTTDALQALAHAVRRESESQVVAITGSTGKTTTKEVTAEFLASRYRVIRNRGNLNNHIGLPLSLLELRRRPDIAVVELGMNHAGELSTLVRVAEPDVRVWTNVGDAHLGFFASVDAIADAKAEIFEGAGAKTLLVANADDARIMARAARFAGRVATFGIDRPADVRATSVEDLGTEGTRAEVVTPTGTASVEVPLVGRGNLANVLAAASVALEFDVGFDAIVERTRNLRPAAHRGEIVRLKGGVTLIDDSYNASPAAVQSALDVLTSTRGGARRVAVLGEMLELGDHATALHQAVGRLAASRADLLFAVGGAPAEALAAEALAAGLAPDRVRYFTTSDEAADAVASMVRGGDLVLVKGSRGIRTDRIVERLKAELA